MIVTGFGFDGKLHFLNVSVYAETLKTIKGSLHICMHTFGHINTYMYFCK